MDPVTADRAELVRLITEEVLEEMRAEAPDNGVSEDGSIPVGVSVRHVHVCREHLYVLYGRGHELTKYRDLYQPGEFAAGEVVTLVGPKMRCMSSVRILGPMRDYTQVELARTDAIFLGVDPPVRQSGDLEGSSPITLVGPEGVVPLKEGAIQANRHIHMGPDEARHLGVRDNDMVEVEVESGEKSLRFSRVQVRVKEGFRIQMHLDTDDANAAGIQCGVKVRIVGD